MEPADYKAAVALFERCLSLDSREREHVLRSECGSNIELRRRVEHMLRADAEGDTPIVHTMMDRVLENVREPDQLPEMLGPYRIICELGRGGMGIVYEAEQAHPRRRVALKALSMFGSRAMASRLRQEAHVLGQLDHPGIARVFDAGSARFHGRLTPYIAMELVRGRPIDEFARERGLDRAQRLELLARVADAVHSAHERGVVHRDLKPGNIFIVDSPDGIGAPKVLDFGVARVHTPELQVTNVHTETGQLIGTLNYMSPEQLVGSPSGVDARADVYALGVVAHELLTGKRPEELDGLPIAQVVDRLRDRRSLKLTIDGTSAPEALTLVVATATANDRERRYPSAAAFAADLRAFIAGTELRARPPSRAYQLRDFARRNRLLVSVTLATIGALAIGLVGTTWFAASAVVNERHARWMSHRAFVAAASEAIGRGDFSSARQILDDCPAEHRGWEWEYLDAQIRPEREAFGGLAIEMLGVDAAGGAFLGVADGRIILWSPDTDQVAAVAFDQPVRQISPRTGGGRCAAITTGGDLVVFDTATGTEVLRVAAEDGQPWQSPSLDRSGTRVCCTSSARGTPVWDVESGALLGEPGRDDRIRRCELSPDGRWVVCVHRVGGGVSLHELLTGRRIKLRCPNPALYAEMSPDGRTIAVATGVRQVFLFDLEQTDPPLADDLAAGAEVRLDHAAELHGHAGGARAISFTGDGKLFTAFSDGTWRAWDVKSRTQIWSRPFPIGSSELAVLGDVVVTAGAQASSAWAAQPPRPMVHPEFVYALGWSPDGRWLASMAYEQGGTVVWDARTRIPVATLATRGRTLPLVQFTPDGRLLVQSHARQGRQLFDAWNTDTWTPAGLGLDESQAIAAIPGLASLDRPLERPAPNSPFSAVFESRNVWIIRNGDKRIAHADLSNTDEQISVVVWSPDGHSLVTGGRPGTARVWRAPDFNVIAEVPHVPGLWAAAFTPDGTRLVTGGDDGVIRMFDTRNWEQLLELRGHKTYVHALAFSPDGTRLASGSGDGTIRIWEIASGNERTGSDVARRPSEHVTGPRASAE